MIRGKRVYALVRRFVRRIFVRPHPVPPPELPEIDPAEWDLADIAALQEEIRLMILELEAKVVTRE